MKVDAELVGAKELTRAVRKAEADLQGDLKAVNLDNAKDVAAAVDVPVRTGKLKGTLRTSATLRWSTVRVGTTRVPYAPPIHWGWPAHNIEPQPFLYEALDQRIPDVRARYELAAQRLAERINAAA